jgi:hypothetical protein
MAALRLDKNIRETPVRLIFLAKVRNLANENLANESLANENLANENPANESLANENLETKTWLTKTWLTKNLQLLHDVYGEDNRAVYSTLT